MLANFICTGAIFYLLVKIAMVDVLFLKIRNKDLLIFVCIILAGSAMKIPLFQIQWWAMVFYGFIAFSFFFAFFSLGMMGAGDVKLAGVLGALFGIQDALVLWLASCVLAGLYVVWMRSGWRARSLTPVDTNERVNTKRCVPYGAAMCVSAAVLLLRRAFVTFGVAGQ